jgi:hypothetical protein
MLFPRESEPNFPAADIHCLLGGDGVLRKKNKMKLDKLTMLL